MKRRDHLVRRRPTQVAGIAVALLLVAGSYALSRTTAWPAWLLAWGQTARFAGLALRPVSVPDLSKMSGSVQNQIRTSHAALTRAIDDRQTQAVEVADAYGALGKLLMAADLPDAAEPYLLNAQALAPSDARWPYYLGHLNRNRGELATATTFFARALELQPDDVASLVWMGELGLAQGQAADAEPHFARALSRQPTSLSARFGLGRTALAHQDYRRATTYLEEVLAQDPGAAAAHYPLGLAYRGLGDAEQAEAHLRRREDHKILPADPLMVELEELLESPQAYESRGIRALDRKDFTEAAALFRRGLEVSPGNAALLHRLGTALHLLGDSNGAKANFEEAVRRSPDYHLAQYSLGVLLQAEGKHAEAIERFSAALKSRPADTASRLRLAAGLRRMGRASESLPHYEQVVAAQPELAEAGFGYAIALAQLQRYREALDRLQDGMTQAAKGTAEQLFFAHAVARLLATAADDRVRDGRRAMSMMQELLKQERTLDLGATMAMTLAELGQFEQAATVQRDLIAAARNAGFTEVSARLANNLALYQRGQPCRTPWTADEVP